MLAKSTTIYETATKPIRFIVAFAFSLFFMNLLIGMMLAFWIPFFLWYMIAILLAKWLMPGSKVLTLQDSGMAKGQVYRQKDLYLTGHLNFEGRLNFEDFVEKWVERVMGRKRPNGEMKFPELKCYIETRWGLSFYRAVENFDLKNHIHLYEDPEKRNSVVDRRKLDRIKREFTDKLFEAGQSPWEILIVNNCRLEEDEGKEYTIIISKFHHCLGDGYCAMLLFWNALFLQEIPNLKKPKTASLKINIFQRVAIILSAAYNTFILLARAPFYFIYRPAWVFDENSFHRRDQVSDSLYCTLKPIETSLVKEISQHYGVNITATLLSISAAASRRMMAANGLEPPKNIRTIYSLPFPNHPDRLTTWSSATYFDINVSDGDIKKRLKITENNMNVAVRALLLFGTQFGMFMLRFAPISQNLLIKPSRILAASMFCATVPMPSPPSGCETEFLGCRLAGQYSTCEIVTSNFAIKSNTLKYKNHFFMNFGIQSHLLKTEDQIYDIEKYVWEEIDHLRSSIPAKQKDDISLTIISESEIDSTNL